MKKSDVEEIIKNGESSGVEFKCDDINIQDLAKEIVAFANFQGGIILLGVKDDGTISGTTREDVEEWIMEACRKKVEPEIIPFYENVSFEEGKNIAVVKIGSGTSKPYAMLHHGHRYYYI